MPNILDEIVENKKKEIRRGIARNAHNTGFARKTPTNDITLIAEIKLKSPSSGILATEEQALKKAIEYEKYGADCISIITDKKYFGGSIELVKKIRAKVNLPILQKDFVIDPYQIYESKIIGADAILLIARIFSQKKLNEFVNLSLTVGVEPVVEVYDELDLKKVLKTKARVIGVNARDLTNFEVNIDNACRLIEKIPKNKIKIGFSGVNSREEVEKYKKSGANAILVGTSLMKTDDVKNFIYNLKNGNENKS